MKWNGTVSQREKTTMATRLASEKAIHATSSQTNGQRSGGRPRGQCRPASRCGQCRRPPGTTSGGEPIALTTHRLDQVEAELGAQPPHADVDHSRARIEVVSPDRGKQLALADRLPRVLHQLPEQQELEPGQ